MKMPWISFRCFLCRLLLFLLLCESGDGFNCRQRSQGGARTHPNMSGEAVGGGWGDQTQRWVLNSSVNVCAVEYDGADKESETKPDVVFLPVLVAPGC